MLTTTASNRLSLLDRITLVVLKAAMLLIVDKNDLALPRPEVFSSFCKHCSVD